LAVIGGDTPRLIYEDATQTAPPALLPRHRLVRTVEAEEFGAVVAVEAVRGGRLM
jgi:hypothetical protein